VPVLTTPRLSIRPLELNDLQSCCDLFASIGRNDPTLGAEERSIAKEIQTETLPETTIGLIAERAAAASAEF